jgi:anthranilate phosphoribosyltransferase
VAAGAGAVVAKHGNRSVSSLCGSADVLAELGVNLDAEPDLVEECVAEIGIGFLFAPKLHPAMKHAIGPRKEMGIRTLFNLLGPLSNPAGASAQVLGVFHPTLTETFARVLSDLGSRHAMVVHGLDGLDEITVTGPTRVCELKDGLIRTYNLDPEPYVDRLAGPEELEGGDAARNAGIIQGILGGESGPRRDVTVLNAGAALVVAGKAADLNEGVEAACRSIDAGLAREKLEALVEMSNS